MSMGYDVAELMAEISKLRMQVAANNFNEAEIKLLVEALHERHTPESAFRPMAAEAVTVIQKLQVLLDGFERVRNDAAAFALSLTDEERLLVLEARKSKKSL